MSYQNDLEVDSKSNQKGVDQSCLTRTLFWVIRPPIEPIHHSANNIAHTGEKSYSLLLVAFLLVSAVAATACAGYSYGVKNGDTTFMAHTNRHPFLHPSLADPINRPLGLSLSQTVTSLAVIPKFYTSRYYYIPGHQVPLPPPPPLPA